ncbi:MAG: nucleotidyltransferase family protein [bacterium]
MKTANEFKAILAQHKKKLQQDFHIKRLGIFGSYSRGEPTEDSDVDILVEFDQPIGLDFVELAYQLEDLLKIKVDLVSKKAIKPKMWKYLKDDVIYV